jgi:tape measure domain-containing protein
MGDGIKFLIDLDSRTRGAVEANSVLAKLNHTAQGLGQNLQHTGHHCDALSSNLFKAEVAGGLAAKGIELGFELVKREIEKVIEGMKEAINVMASAQREELVLTNLLGDRGEAREQLEYLEKFSLLSEFSGKQTKGFAIDLQKAGYEGGRFKNALELVADAAALSSDKLAGAQDAVSSLTRMQLTGKVDARTLKGLGLDARDILGELQHTMGVGKATLAKMIKDGSLPAEKAFDAVLVGITKKTHKGLGEAGMAMGEGLEAKLTHLREIPERIYERLKDSPVADKLGTLFDKALEAFDPDGPKGQKIFRGIETFLDTLANIDTETITMFFADVPGLLSEWIEPIGKVVGLVGDLTKGMLALPTFGTDLGDWLARKLHPELNPSERDMRRMGLKGLKAPDGAGEWFGPNSALAERTQADFDRANEKAWASVPLADLQRARQNGTAATGITATAHVTVDARGHAKPEEVGEAAKEGAKQGMTKALETHTLQKGLRPARAGGY